MATKKQLIDFFSKYNPSGGGVEEWNLWCQALVGRAAKQFGTWKRTYGRADWARAASGKLNTDLSKAKPGAIGWWAWGDYGHVAVYMGGGVWFMGSRHVTERIGGVARNLGFVTHKDFQARANLKFLGWTPTNGGNVVPITVPKTDPKIRIVGPNGANARTAPNTSGPVVNLRAPGTQVKMVGFSDAGLAVGDNARWFKAADGSWYWSGGFTSTAKTGLTDLTPAPPVPVVPAPVVPQPEPEPEPVQPVVPAPVEPEPPAPLQPTEETPVSKPIIDPNLDKLDDAVEVIADQIGGLLDPTVRKKVYTVVVALNVLALAVGSSLIAAGGFIGGEVGVTLLTVGGITTAVGTALGGAASALARKNV